MKKYDKLYISLKYYLLGKEYFRAADALEFGASIHTGFRKDGKTPEFQHQVEIAHYIRTLLPWLQFPEDTLIAAILHDTKEDYGTLLSVFNDRYGARVANSVDLLDKNGKSLEQYYAALAQDAIGSVVKGADRIHNVNTMVGVFSIEKQVRYWLQYSRVVMETVTVTVDKGTEIHAFIQEHTW